MWVRNEARTRARAPGEERDGGGPEAVHRPNVAPVIDADLLYLVWVEATGGEVILRTLQADVQADRRTALVILTTAFFSDRVWRGVHGAKSLDLGGERPLHWYGVTFPLRECGPSTAGKA